MSCSFTLSPGMPFIWATGDGHYCTSAGPTRGDTVGRLIAFLGLAATLVVLQCCLDCCGFWNEAPKVSKFIWSVHECYLQHRLQNRLRWSVPKTLAGETRWWMWFQNLSFLEWFIVISQALETLERSDRFGRVTIGVPGMGCMSCAKGKFLQAHPFSYPLWAQPKDPIFNKDAEMDICILAGNLPPISPRYT